jgi:hypothetical protein
VPSEFIVSQKWLFFSQIWMYSPGFSFTASPYCSVQ